jgi:alpha-amylase
MVDRCNKAGVRIYVDAVINHMSATSGRGSAGTDCNAGSKSFPGVPFGPNDFNDGN